MFCRFSTLKMKDLPGKDPSYRTHCVGRRGLLVAGSFKDAPSSGAEEPMVWLICIRVYEGCSYTP
jgi:hypothetical protein